MWPIVGYQCHGQIGVLFCHSYIILTDHKHAREIWNVFYQNSKVVKCYGHNKMCLWNMDAPSGHKVKFWQNLKWHPPHPQGHVISVKCKQSVDELMVQIWLMYPDLSLQYCTLCRWDRFTDRKQTHRQKIRLLDCQADLSGRTHINEH